MNDETRQSIRNALINSPLHELAVAHLKSMGVLDAKHSEVIDLTMKQIEAAWVEAQLPDATEGQKRMARELSRSFTERYSKGRS